jgi:tripartite ATP-independent transporter DctM subunit
MSQILIFLGILGILITLNVPIVFSLMIVSWIFFRFGDIALPVVVIGQKLIVGISSTPLLAVPFFMLSAQIMCATSIVERLVFFVNSTIGFVQSGLAIVNVVVSMIFAGMSGSATADTAGVSAMIMNAMIKEGYDRPFSVAITGASSTIGIIIPPSIPFVIYAWVSGSSVAALFLSGFFPGILVGLFQIAWCIYIGKKRNYPKHPRLPFSQIIKDTYKAIPVLLLPVIILGGIFGGIVTPTEASIIAVFYALGLSIYFRELTIEKLFQCLLTTGVTSSISLLLVGFTTPFSWLLSFHHTTESVANWILSYNTSPITFLSVVVLFLLVLGCLMDDIPIILITTPIFLPIAVSLGISPILYGTILILSIAIGFITPPVGCVLFVSCAVGHTTIAEVVPEYIPFYILMIFIVIMIIFFPQIALYLPLKFMPLSVY